MQEIMAKKNNKIPLNPPKQPEIIQINKLKMTKGFFNKADKIFFLFIYLSAKKTITKLNKLITKELKSGKTTVYNNIGSNEIVNKNLCFTRKIKTIKEITAKIKLKYGNDACKSML